MSHPRLLWFLRGLWLGGVLVGLLFMYGQEDANAHPLPPKSGVKIGLHRICTTINVCKDVAPRPGPTNPCNDSNRGSIERIWDDRLGAYVEWQCTDTGWRRVGIFHRAALPWDPPQRMWVQDRMRACASIVCVPVWVAHRYPTRWAFGR